MQVGTDRIDDATLALLFVGVQDHSRVWNELRLGDDGAPHLGRETMAFERDRPQGSVLGFGRKLPIAQTGAGLPDNAIGDHDWNGNSRPLGDRVSVS